MSLGYRNKMPAGVTVISNGFIDEYMAAANGEYVKVFLYVLRHENEEVEVSAIADALNHTEADVRRALSYWERAGVLEADEEEKADSQAEEYGKKSGEEQTGENSPAAEAKLSQAASLETVSRNAVPDAGDSYERLERLANDEEFSALLYAVQQYLGKTFTQIECEKFAFFYDGLHMSGELLEYLAEYCAEGGHANIRYIEKVAINWYQAGIHTREEAREQTARFSRDTSAVMKAFGITGRSAGTAEQDFMRRWFKEFGFDASIVTEACNRTITATGTASFPYADKILAGWKESGVKTLRDVETLDKRHQEKKAAGKAAQAGHPNQSGQKKTPNRFRNFEERSYNYEDYVWEGMKNRRKGGNADGTE